jgi:hypothetical protein
MVSAFVQYWSAWHMTAAFNIRWKRSMSPLTGGYWAVCRESCVPQLGQGVEELRFKLTSLVDSDGLRTTEVGYPGGQ